MKRFCCILLWATFALTIIFSNADASHRASLLISQFPALVGGDCTTAAGSGSIGCGSTFARLSSANTFSSAQTFSAGLQTGSNISGTTTSGAYSIGADNTYGASIAFYGSTNGTPNVLALNSSSVLINAPVTTLNGSSVSLTAAPLGLPKLSAAPSTAPGAGKAVLFFVAGTNSGTCKIQALAGTSTTPVTVLDNIGSGC